MVGVDRLSVGSILEMKLREHREKKSDRRSQMLGTLVANGSDSLGFLTTFLAYAESMTFNDHINLT